MNMNQVNELHILRLVFCGYEMQGLKQFATSTFWLSFVLCLPVALLCLLVFKKKKKYDI